MTTTVDPTPAPPGPDMLEELFQAYANAWGGAPVVTSESAMTQVKVALRLSRLLDSLKETWEEFFRLGKQVPDKTHYIRLQALYELWYRTSRPVLGRTGEAQMASADAADWEEFKRACEDARVAASMDLDGVWGAMDEIRQGRARRMTVAEVRDELRRRVGK